MKRGLVEARNSEAAFGMASDSVARARIAFVGTCPGRADLVTVRGLALVERAAIVVFDRGVPEDLLDLVPGIRREKSPDAIAELVSKVEKGAFGVRLVAGDPLGLARCQEEVADLSRRNLPFEIVPAVSAASFAAAFSGAPLVRSSDASPSYAVARVDHANLHVWEHLSVGTDTLALDVEGASVAEIARTLVFHGRPPSDPCTLVAQVGLPAQRVERATLAKPPRLESGGRVWMLVGQEARFGWFERLPLFGKRVLVTRPRGQTKELVDGLRELGAEPLVAPSITMVAPPDALAVSRAIDELRTYDWVAFTSANGVAWTWSALREKSADPRAFGKAKIAAIGPGTARALSERGIVADAVAEAFHGEGLAARLLHEVGPGARVLLLRALVARDVLPETLRAAGVHVDVVAVYETRSPDASERSWVRQELEKGAIDVVTFTSSSTVDSTFELLGADALALLGRAVVASIGPVTTETCRRRGLEVHVTAPQHTVFGLIEAVRAHFSG